MRFSHNVVARLGAVVLVAAGACRNQDLLAQYGPSIPSPGGYNPTPRSPRPGYGSGPSTRPQPHRPSPYRSPSYPNQPRPGHYDTTPRSPYGPTTQPQRPSGGFQNPLYRRSRPSYPSASDLRFGTSPHNRVYGQPVQPQGQHWNRAGSLARNGQFDRARSLIDQQLQRNRSLNNYMSAVWTLEQANANRSTLQPYRQQALQLARQQAQQNVHNPMPYVAIAKFSLEDQNDRAFREATETLVERFPNQKHSHYFNGIRALKDEDWETAEVELRKAREMGVPEESVAQWLKMAIDKQRWVWQYAQITGITIAVWLAGLAVLFLIGKFLSRESLRTVRRGDPAKISLFQRLERFLYRITINVAGLYYFISLPMVVVLSIALPLSVGYALLNVPYLNLWLIALVLILSVGSFVTALSGLRTCFVRVRSDTEGRSITPDEYPRLWQVTHEVAEKVGTRPVDEIWLVPSATIGVIERGGFLARMRDRGKRALILGIGTLDGFELNSFRAVLAHEYGHFLHRDTLGGDVALRVILAMENFAEAIMRRGKIRKWDVAVWFLRFYFVMFNRITFGATRLQEVLADRVAALAYGPRAFKRGLTHAIRRSVEFEFDISENVGIILRKEALATNLYGRRQRTTLSEQDEMGTLIGKLINRPTTTDDTHPSPRERFAFVDQFDEPELKDEGTYVWSLFDERDKITGDATKRLASALKQEADIVRQVSGMKLSYVNRVLRHQPDPRGLEARAALHSERGDFQDALSDLNQVINRQPGAPSVWAARAMVYRAAKDYRSAAESIEQLMQLDATSQDFDTYFALGDCYFRLREFEKAERAFARAVHLDAKPFAGWLALGRARCGLQKFDAAIGDLEAAAERVPYLADPLYYLARARWNAGQHDLALEDFRKAIEIDGGLAELRKDYARALKNYPGGNSAFAAEAEKQLEAAREISGRDDDAELETPDPDSGPDASVPSTDPETKRATEVADATDSITFIRADEAPAEPRLAGADEVAEGPTPEKPAANDDVFDAVLAEVLPDQQSTADTVPSAGRTTLLPRRGDRNAAPDAASSPSSNIAIPAEIIEEPQSPVPDLKLGSVLPHGAKRRKSRARLVCLGLLLLIGGGLAGYFVARMRTDDRSEQHQELSSAATVDNDRHSKWDAGENSDANDESDDEPVALPASPFTEDPSQTGSNEKSKNTRTSERFALPRPPTVPSPEKPSAPVPSSSADVVQEPPRHIEFVPRLLNEVSLPPEPRETNVRLDRLSNDWITAVRPVGGEFDADLCRVTADGKNIVALVDQSLVKIDARGLQVQRAIELPWANKLDVCAEGILVSGGGQMALFDEQDLSVRAVYQMDGNVKLIGAAADCAKVALVTGPGTASTGNDVTSIARLMLIDLATRKQLLDCETGQLNKLNSDRVRFAHERHFSAIEELVIDARGFLLAVRSENLSRADSSYRRLQIYTFDEGRIEFKGTTRNTRSDLRGPCISPDELSVMVCVQGRGFGGSGFGGRGNKLKYGRVERYLLDELSGKPIRVYARYSDSFVWYGRNGLLVTDTSQQTVLSFRSLESDGASTNPETWSIQPEPAVELERLERILPLADSGRIAGVGTGRLFLLHLDGAIQHQDFSQQVKHEKH